jgi:uncharacterized Tic20 family protein
VANPPSDSADHGSVAPPGWYPDQFGQPRWWDGQVWGAAGAPVSPTLAWGPRYANAPVVGGQTIPWLADNERTLALFAHLGRLFGGFIVPLIIMLTAGKESLFVRDQAVEALNFDLSVLLAAFCCIPLLFVLVGFVILPVVLIGSIILAILAGIKAHQGVAYRYPIIIRFVH